MNLLMTFSTHNVCFPSSCCHLFDPDRFFFSSWLFQIGELTDMMNLYLLFRAAEFTFICQNSLKEFAPIGHDELGETINKDGILFPFERDTPKTSDKWLLVFSSLNNHLQAFLWPIRCFDGGFMPLCHLRDGRPVFAC